MKTLIFLFVLLCSFTAAAAAQSKTILLVRHAEKIDESQDPELSAAGKERAERLVKKIGRFRPGAFYSTNYKRTRDTIAPLAARRRKPVQTYDARLPQALIDEIMKSKTKRFVIAGHSNTIPGLANLITKKELFKNLADSEFSVIWLIKLKDGKIRKFELLEY
ncbi:MAG: histidine phosphatase family protein [Acidobacteria bacterium]|nr:histidine phosphatase family protein [Acidobacteriota bacterium]